MVIAASRVWVIRGLGLVPWVRAMPVSLADELECGGESNPRSLCAWEIATTRRRMDAILSRFRVNEATTSAESGSEGEATFGASGRYVRPVGCILGPRPSALRRAAVRLRRFFLSNHEGVEGARVSFDVRELSYSSGPPMPTISSAPAEQVRCNPPVGVATSM
jgi:hypothetical protein